MTVSTETVMAEQLAAAERHLVEMPLDPATRDLLAGDLHLRHMIKIAMLGFAADSVAQAFRAFAAKQKEGTS